MVFEKVEMDEAIQVDPLMSGLFLGIYYVMVVLIMRNVFVAIFIDGYRAAAERYEEGGIYADNLRYEMGSIGFNAHFADDFTGRIDMHQVMDHIQMGANIREQEELDAIFKITDREEGIKALAIHYAVAFDEDVSEWMGQTAEEWDEEHEEVDEEDLDFSWLDNIVYPNSDDLDTDISVYRAD